MKSKIFFLIKESQIELSKITVALVGIANMALVGHTLGKYFLVIFVFSQSIFVISSSALDFGKNVSNVNVEIPENTFQQTRVPLYLYFIVFAILFAYLHVFVSGKFLISDLMLFFSILINSVGGIYLMRWLTIKRRAGKVLFSVLLGELLPAILRTASIFIGYCFGVNVFILFIAFIPVVVSCFISKFSPVTNLHLINLSTVNNKNNLFCFDAYLLSILSSIKNQILSILLPFVTENNQPFVVIVSRIYGISVLAVSGIVARIPSSVVKWKIYNQRSALINQIIFVVVSVALLIAFSKYLILLASIVFGLGGGIILTGNQYIVFFWVVLGVVVGMNSIILQSLSKIRLGIAIDIFYSLMLATLLIIS